MKLTVMIPVYNGSGSITRCLDSLGRQTFQDFQVLLIDDGSTDDSAAVIRKYMENHPGMHITLRSRENRGVAETRNEGIEQAEGTFIAFIDQDDFVGETYLEEYVRVAEQRDADIVCGGYIRYDPENKRALRTVRLTENPWSRFVVSAPWAHLYRCDFLKAHPVRYLKTAIGEDVYFSLMAYAYTDRVETIPNTDYYWVDNPKSHSNSNQKKVRKDIDPFILLDALQRDLPEDSRIPPEYLEYYLYRYIVWYLLFTVRKTPKEQMEEQYGKLMDWLKKHYPGFAQNRLISLTGPAGEPFSIRLSVWGFTRLYRMHLALPALKLLAAKKG